ncbi:unnamed protein product [Gadus morhua 'NCC']
MKSVPSGSGWWRGRRTLEAGRWPPPLPPTEEQTLLLNPSLPPSLPPSSSLPSTPISPSLVQFPDTGGRPGRFSVYKDTCGLGCIRKFLQKLCIYCLNVPVLYSSFFPCI